MTRPSNEPAKPVWRRIAVRVAVVLAIAAGVPAFLNSEKSVQLTVDGQTSTVNTSAGTVAGFLARAGIQVGEHDTVVPALDRRISDGQRVAVRFGRPLSLEVDGSTREVWVTATSVSEALAEIGLREGGMYVSASRSAPIGREGLNLKVRIPRDVTVIADGRTLDLQTVATTVRAVLAEAGVKLDQFDEVSPELDVAPKDGSTIRIVRVDARKVTVKVDVPFRTIRIPDRSMFRGEQRVTTEGRKGVKEVTYALLTRDGKAKGRESVGEKVLRAPRAEVVRIGTKVPQFARTGAEGLNWFALARCESGNNPRAVSPYGYYGLYQFSTPTWRAVGGKGLPSHASPAEQTYRAQLLYKKAGSGQWPVCGRHLFR